MCGHSLTKNFSHLNNADGAKMVYPHPRSMEVDGIDPKGGHLPNAKQYRAEEFFFFLDCSIQGLLSQKGRGGMNSGELNIAYSLEQNLLDLAVCLRRHTARHSLQVQDGVSLNSTLLSG